MTKKDCAIDGRLAVEQDLSTATFRGGGAWLLSGCLPSFLD